MLDIGIQELAVVFVIALLVFGPKNLPQLGRALGRAMREFRRASDEFRSTIETNLQINEPDLSPGTPVVPAAETPGPASPAFAEALPEAAPDGAVAVATETAPPPPEEAYLAQRGARLFHARDCGWVARIPEAERIYWKRVAEAREAGFVGCPVCEPWEPA